MVKEVKLLFKRIKAFMVKNKEPFARGESFDKLFLIFVLASMLGTYYEQILNLVKYYFKYGIIFWEYRRGVIYGPFNPLYGFGIILIIMVLARKKDKLYVTFLKAALIGGAVEYIINFLQEIFLNNTSWNYSNHFLNINGRTTIPFMIVWGALGVLFVKVIYPYVSSKIEKIPYNLGKIIITTLIIFMTVDISISWGAIIRQSFRRAGHPPFTIIGEKFDEFYNDEMLERYFPNMKVSGKK